ncbi:efflux ABC transporter, permease protein [Gleimia coleocanis DSM 15436]|uniref:Efflux ABC transporter, permease protein n=1 Tax=Gleimia coleocanis DSM 15436 TaxID=525245 RepID=C0W063_9ACTO|nr:FtsX-like permease family protein [Gleimia coleocanis]EEH63922.1 efflux ABC transporter, permease protein [Gleimia coleocanis DSM 15436]
MFLALKEIRHSASRFVLITAVIFLVSYLVYFLTGLAYGLSSSYSEAVKDWKANSIVLSEASHYNVTASRITNKQASEILLEDETAVSFSVSPVVVDLPNKDDAPAETKKTRKNAFIFGIDLNSELAPTLIEGKKPTEEYEIIADADFKIRGFELGDTVKLPVAQATDASDIDWKIVGFTAAKFQAAPTFFVDVTSYKDHLRPLQNPHIDEADQLSSNAIVLLNPPSENVKELAKEAELELVAPNDYINNLPGYRAQTLTFMLMIGSLIGILALVLSIFFYVLTVQKKQIFGIMKAQGISTAYIAKAGVMQTLALSVIGVSLGLGAVLATTSAIGGAIPFRIEPTFYTAVTAAFIISAVLGGLIPTRMISRIDPIEAIN